MTHAQPHADGTLCELTALLAPQRGLVVWTLQAAEGSSELMGFMPLFKSDNNLELEVIGVVQDADGVSWTLVAREAVSGAFIIGAISNPVAAAAAKLQQGHRVHAAISAIAYHASISKCVVDDHHAKAPHDTSPGEPKLRTLLCGPTANLPNEDALIAGFVVETRHESGCSPGNKVWSVSVDCGPIVLPVSITTSDISGEPTPGDHIQAKVWVQIAITSTAESVATPPEM